MKTEKVVLSIVVLGLLFKFQHWAFGSQILILSLTTFSGLYFPLGFYFLCDKDIKNQNIALSIISGILLSVIPIGILFKLQYWPEPQQFLIAGVIATPVLLAVALYFKSKSPVELKTYYKGLVTRVVFFLVISFVFYFTPSSTIVNIQYHDDPEMARLVNLRNQHPYDTAYQQNIMRYIDEKNAEMSSGK